VIAARYTQGGGLEIGNAPEPQPGPHDLLLDVVAASICGTDAKIVRHGHRKLRQGQTITLGHEFVGRVIKADSSGRWPVGRLVGVVPNIGCGGCEMCARGLGNMCPTYSAFGIDRDGAHASQVVVPAAAIAQGLVIALAQNTDVVNAALAEPLSCAVSSIRNCRLEPGDTVLIYGAGPMGLLNLAVALCSGASEVIVVDKNADRLELALKMGASFTVDATRCEVAQAVRDCTRDRGMDVAIVAVPAAEPQAQAISLLAPFGRLCLFAGLPRGADAVSLDTNAIHYRNLVVTGMTGGSPRDYLDATRLIQSGRVDVRRVVSHVLPLSELRQAYDLVLGGRAMKVVLTR
jgi:threonine dehydrogenase-like Zn-dependent dehydrogenase